MAETQTKQPPKGKAAGNGDQPDVAVPAPRLRQRYLAEIAPALQIGRAHV